MPTDTDILFWNDEQRAAGFRMLDRLGWLVDSRVIAAGGEVLALPAGEDITPDLDLDLDAYMASQRSAAIVVVQDGEVVLERYGLGFGPEGRWTSFSVAKSLTSTLVGAAIKDGAIQSLEDPVSSYIPDLRGSAYDDVTIRQLLTMSSGVRWNEDYSDPQSDVARFNAHEPEEGVDATVSYMRGLERESPPGERWVYKTGETNLIGILVSETTGKPLAEYLSEKVWRPFGMEQDATWLLNPTGNEISGCCIQAATRDMARFGLFVLADGVAGGQRMVPEGWFAEATSTHYDTDRARRNYGYQWWTYADGSFAAGGIFGQGIFIDPARNLVIASNANWPLATDDEGRGLERDLFYQAVQQAVDVRNARSAPAAADALPELSQAN
ncbi:class C beta-lactamase-related serine hydrolase [Alteraurantiacibacter aquimixticola]|uniref:Class C beta-lactamase-related serine hydrolase n=2 Tax=Alteraurantiacibacter aquimixticola TaxID=2489173 RepID=A0A4T3F126_9SPHN|nr:class C beta-lactamase-related serine hydrolase [Alteraurantiacibacter aquimixticola]